MPRCVTVVRCPRCGSTDAGEVGAFFDLAEMRCAACGHSAVCDDHQIKGDWNAPIELADDATSLPERVPVDPVSTPTPREPKD